MAGLFIWRDYINSKGGICIDMDQNLYSDSADCTNRKKVNLVVWDACGNNISLDS